MDNNSITLCSEEDIIDALFALADESRAISMQRFFKTGPGQYAEGDRFLGLSNPQVRSVVKLAWKNASFDTAVSLSKKPWHEVRLCGLLILVEKYVKALKKNDLKEMDCIYNLYLTLHPYINNWDLVDLTAIKIVGNHEYITASSDEMYEWIKPGHTLWQKRIAMVSTWMLIHKGLPEIAFQRATFLLDSKEDLLHKASGWMLREAWKYGYQDNLRNFLNAYVDRMPSVMLSYACEQMSLDERRHWQQMRRLSK